MERLVTFATDRLQRTSSFERALFDDGRVEFGGFAPWYKEYLSRKAASDDEFASEYDYELREGEWKQKYSYKIPSRWETWSNISNDIKDANILNVKLTSVLINAAVEHPHGTMWDEITKFQKLSNTQLGLLVRSHDLSESDLKIVQMNQANLLKK